MKKSIATTALLAVLASPAMADVNVYGSLEQGFSVVDGVVSSTNSNSYFGLKADAYAGEGLSAFAKVELGYDADGVDGVGTKDAHLGLDMGNVVFKAGRMMNLESNLVSAQIDTFEGSSFATENAKRVNNHVMATATTNGLTLGIGATIDGASGEDVVDNFAVGATHNIAGFTIAGVYASDLVTDTDTMAFSAATSVAGFKLAAAYEPDATAGETITLVGAKQINAYQTIRAGVSMPEVGDQRYVVEGHHALSNAAALYVNYETDDNDATDAAIGAGFRVTF